MDCLCWEWLAHVLSIQEGDEGVDHEVVRIDTLGVGGVGKLNGKAR